MVIRLGPLTIMSSPILMLDGANNNSTLKQMTIKESIKSEVYSSFGVLGTSLSQDFSPWITIWKIPTSFP